MSEDCVYFVVRGLSDSIHLWHGNTGTTREDVIAKNETLTDEDILLGPVSWDEAIGYVERVDPEYAAMRRNVGP